jgi:hypothetical protein
MVTKLKKEKPLKTWGDVDRYMKSLGYVYVNQLKTKSTWQLEAE